MFAFRHSFMLISYALAAHAASAADSVPAPPVMFVIDSSPSMKEEMEHRLTRFQALRDSLAQMMNQAPANQQVGLSAFGMGRGCGDGNTRVLVPSDTGSENRSRVNDAADALRSGSGTPFVLAMQKAVQNMTGTLIPTKKVLGDQASRNRPRPMPDPNSPLGLPDPNLPTAVFVTDMGDTCQQDACQFMKDLEASGTKMRICVVGVGIKHNHQAREMLDCMGQFPNFCFEEVSSKVGMKNAFAKLMKGEELSAHAGALPPVNSTATDARVRGRKTTVSGMVMPANHADATVDTSAETSGGSSMEGLHAVEMPPLPYTPGE